MQIANGARLLITSKVFGYVFASIAGSSKSGYITGYMPSPITRRKAVQAYRQRTKERGWVRLEVQTPREDVALIRHITQALRSDPARAAQLRRHLHRLIDPEPHADLKALLASAPLDGIDLSRRHDRGREVDL